MLQQYLDLLAGKRVRDEDLLFDMRMIGPELRWKTKIGGGKAGASKEDVDKAVSEAVAGARAEADSVLADAVRQSEEGLNDAVSSARQEQHYTTARAISQTDHTLPGSWPELHNYLGMQGSLNKIIERLRPVAHKAPYVVLNPTGTLNPPLTKYNAATAEELANAINSPEDAVTLQAFSSWRGRPTTGPDGKITYGAPTAGQGPKFVQDVLKAPYALNEDRHYTFANLNALLNSPLDKPIGGGLTVEQGARGREVRSLDDIEQLTPKQILARGFGVNQLLNPPNILPIPKRPLTETELAEIAEREAEERGKLDAKIAVGRVLQVVKQEDELEDAWKQMKAESEAELAAEAAAEAAAAEAARLVGEQLDAAEIAAAAERGDADMEAALGAIAAETEIQSEAQSEFIADITARAVEASAETEAPPAGDTLAREPGQPAPKEPESPVKAMKKKIDEAEDKAAREKAQADAAKPRRKADASGQRPGTPRPRPKSKSPPTRLGPPAQLGLDDKPKDKGKAVKEPK